MAEVVVRENIGTINNNDTITGLKSFYLVLVGGSQTAQLVLTAGSAEFRLKAKADETTITPYPIRIGRDVVATITVSGAAAKAYAIFEVR